MTDTPGWAPPSSSEQPGEEGRPPAGAPTVPGQSSPHGSTPPPWGGGYGGPPPGGPKPWGGAPGGQPWGGQPWGGQPGGWPQSPKPGVIPLRPLGVGEILDGAFSTVRRHWRTTLGISLGLAVLQQTIVVLIQWQSYQNPDSVLPVVSALVSVPLTLLIGVVATALLTMVVSRAILGRAVTVGEAWRDARPRVLQLLGLTLLNALIMLGIVLVAAAPLIGYLIASRPDPNPGLVVLLAVVVVAGVLAAGWITVQLSLAAPALMLEKQGIRAAFSRSRRLVRGSWWRVFGISALGSVLVSIIAGIIEMPFSIVGVVMAGDELFGDSLTTGLDPALPPAALVVIAVGGVIGGTITIPAGAAINVLIYVDQRIRREALDIELTRAAGLAEPGPVEPAGPAGPTDGGDPAAARL
ncbi:hypothetical protein GCM10010495_29800 [Kitasatospora herbaricolor]|uniref:DUF7544 domain-containing protein n=1 Tax=Kitasatospora herbaricolor TaxID=68217 RepID=UPI00174A548B|nr:hypothetical protein [Kitasatospora herbaricolor]MDQ0308642.1 hypothetical protein [Kitasatospora herbaricolor]GGV13869.1 hypothetical protein GCM10010495_29800 [Kitasatospora herbaricolor]